MEGYNNTNNFTPQFISQDMMMSQNMRINFTPNFGLGPNDNRQMFINMLFILDQFSNLRICSFNSQSNV